MYSSERIACVRYLATDKYQYREITSYFTAGSVEFKLVDCECASARFLAYQRVAITRKVTETSQRMYNSQHSQHVYMDVANVTSRPVVLNLFWLMDHLLKKYPMDHLSVLTPHEHS